MPGFYFALWCEDKRSLQATRIRNIMSDIDAGYSPFGSVVKAALEEADRASQEYYDAFADFQKMTVAQVDEWCRSDMLRRGSISE